MGEGWKKEQIEKEIPILPLAGFHGENLLKKSEKMPWWKGVTVFDPTTKKEIQVNCLLDALNDMVNLPPRNTEGALRAPVGKVITSIKGIECVVTSRLEQGTLTKGDEVVFLPTHTPSNPCVGKVFSIEMHHREHEKAGPGDNVGVSMKGLPKGNMPRDGDIMVKKSDTEFKASRRSSSRLWCSTTRASCASATRRRATCARATWRAAWWRSASRPVRRAPAARRSRAPSSSRRATCASWCGSRRSRSSSTTSRAARACPAWPCSRARSCA